MKHTNQVCSSCNEDKPLTEYHKNNNRKTGYEGVCKDCRRIINQRNNPRNYPKNNPTSNPNRMFVNGKYISRSHPLYKPGNYKTFEGAAFASLSNYEKSTDGYVYIITNPAWKNWVKVGMAIDAHDRCNQYQTSSPLRDYKLEYSKYFKHRRSAETKAHELCAKQATENNNEWFKININDAINLIESITEEQNERETA